MEFIKTWVEEGAKMVWDSKRRKKNKVSFFIGSKTLSCSFIIQPGFIAFYFLPSPIPSFFRFLYPCAQHKPHTRSRQKFSPPFCLLSKGEEFQLCWFMFWCSEKFCVFPSEILRKKGKFSLLTKHLFVFVLMFASSFRCLCRLPCC